MDCAKVVDQVIADVNPRYTLTGRDAIEAVVTLTLDTIDADVPGDLVECGTWMGGCSFAMLLAQRYAYGEIRRPVWMFDSFQGMAAPSPEDGELAERWYETAKALPKDVANNDYCIAPLADVQRNVRELGFDEHVRLMPGWFSETLAADAKPEQIALLRIDCDWYDPVRLVWEQLEPRVSANGAVIVDDYHAWEGAAWATDDYMASRKWPMHVIPGANGVWLRKVGA
jgi:O-methyltransferase